MRITLLIVATIFAGCAHKVTLMDANVVSMKHRNLEKGQKTQKVGPVDAQFCPEQFKQSSGETMGLIDEAIKTAEQETGADFIRNVRIYKLGNCVGVEGEAFKIVQK